jgi:hypothetical protein
MYWELCNYQIHVLTCAHLFLDLHVQNSQEEEEEEEEASVYEQNIRTFWTQAEPTPRD